MIDLNMLLPVIFQKSCCLIFHGCYALSINHLAGLAPEISLLRIFYFGHVGIYNNKRIFGRRCYVSIYVLICIDLHIG